MSDTDTWSRCEDCGELMFFNHRQASNESGEWRQTHGGCERAAEVRAELPLLYDMAIQACVEVEESIGRFLSESDDQDWHDPATLQRRLLDAYHAASEGVRAETRWRESKAEAVSSP